MRAVRARAIASSTRARAAASPSSSLVPAQEVIGRSPVCADKHKKWLLGRGTSSVATDGDGSRAALETDVTALAMIQAMMALQAVALLWKAHAASHPTMAAHLHRTQRPHALRYPLPFALRQPLPYALRQPLHRARMHFPPPAARVSSRAEAPRARTARCTPRASPNAAAGAARPPARFETRMGPRSSHRAQRP